MKRAANETSITDLLGALSEPVRLRLCRLLDSHELSVGEVAHVVQLPQSTASRHLKVLLDAGWVKKRAEGTAALYRLMLDDLTPLCRALWVTLREQSSQSGEAQFEEDARRLQAVLAERRTDSVAFFGRVGGEWDAVRSELFGDQFTLRAMLGLLPAEWTVADIGCGTGNGAELIAPFVKEVIAIDQSKPMLESARKRLAASGVRNVRFLDGPIEALPLPDASVDAAMCILVLHHVRELPEALAEIRRVLRRGGRLLAIDMYEHDRAIYRNTMGHVHLGFSPESIESLCIRAGFARPRITPLPSEPEARGPGLFALAASKT